MTNTIQSLRNLINSTHTKKKKYIQKGDKNAAMSSCNGDKGGKKSNSSSSTSGKSPNNGSNGVVERMSDANALLPRYLYPLVRHYHDDFYVSRSFEPRLVVQLMSEGFLPIATRGYLLPKLHVERCVLQLNPESKLHISKSTRRKSKRFLLSVNESFDEVVAGCHKQHGTNWLYPQIVASFKAIHQRTIDTNSGGVNAMIMSNVSMEPQDVTPVRFYTVEVWNAETGALAGGELGYSVGGIYSSLTGFSNEDAAGSVQLVALGKLLTKCGFEYWDLGMDLEYKRRLGAGMMQRSEFVRTVKRTRVENKGTVLQCGGERKNAKEIVDWVKPQHQQQHHHQQQQPQQLPQPITQTNGTQQKDEKKTQKEGEERRPPPSPTKESDHQEPNRKKPHIEGKEG